MTSLTLACFAAAVFWLRWRVAGTRGLRVAAVMATLLAMNMAWLYRVYQLHAGGLPVPDHARALVAGSRSLELASPRDARGALLTLGYFCHLVSLGLTIAGLFVLSVASPVRDRWTKAPGASGLTRLARTCTTFLPVVLLGLVLLAIATQRAPMRPQWENLSDPWSPRAWVARLEWVDPLSLAIRDGLPFTDRDGPQFVVFAPVIWLAVALLVWSYGTIRAGLEGSGRRRPAGLVSAGGHSYRRWRGRSRLARRGSRGLSTSAHRPLGPGCAGADLRRRSRRAGGAVAVTAALAAAVALQSAIVWDYALYSDRTAGQIIRAGDAVGTRPEDRRAPGFDPKPVSSQSLTARRQLAGSRYGQRDLE